MVPPTGLPYEYKTILLGTIPVDRPGPCRVLVRPARTLDHDLMYFKRLELTPVEPGSCARAVLSALAEPR